MTENQVFIQSALINEPKKRTPSVTIEKSSNYKGLTGSSSPLPSDLLPNHPLFAFPLLAPQSSPINTLNSYIKIHTSSLTSTYQKYQKKSPFAPKTLQSSTTLKTSSNLHSFYSNLYSHQSTLHKMTLAESTNLESSESFHSSISKQKITESQKDLIQALQRQFASKPSNNKCLQSISSNSSYSGEPDSDQENFVVEESSISLIKSNTVATSLNLELSMMEWDNKRKMLREQADLNTSKNVCLIGESEDFGSELMFQSKVALDTARALEQSFCLESPPEEEGCIRASCTKRLFLNGHTASKFRLLESNKHLLQIPPKILLDSIVFDQETTRTFTCSQSPLLRKFLIFEENRNVLTESNSCLLVSSCSVGGYLSTPSVQYSNSPKAKGFVSLEDLPITDMLSVPILRALQEIQVKLLSCGYEHVVALTTASKVYSWGIGVSGCLGHNNTLNYHLPEAINHLFHDSFTSVDCGGYHTLALSENGDVWAWGRNDVGQCGLSPEKTQQDDIGSVALYPLKLKNLPTKTTQISCGEAHSLFLTSSGTLFSSGWNDESQLGTTAKSTPIAPVDIPEKVVKTRAGSIFSVALTDSGKIFVWGNGEHGELGLGNSIKKVQTPTILTTLAGECIIDIVCGESHTLVLTIEKVFAWGKGIVDDFQDPEKFPKGSDIICYAPVPVTEVNTLQSVLIGKLTQCEFTQLVSDKLKKLGN